MAAGPLHATLVANTVTTLALDLTDPVGDIRSFAAPPVAQVEVLNVACSLSSGYRRFQAILQP